MASEGRPKNENRVFDINFAFFHTEKHSLGRSVMLSAARSPSAASGISYDVPERRRSNNLSGHREWFAKWDQLPAFCFQLSAFNYTMPRRAYFVFHQGCDWFLSVREICVSMPRRAYFVFHLCNAFGRQYKPNLVSMPRRAYFVFHPCFCKPKACHLDVFQCPEGLILYFTFGRRANTFSKP